MSLMKRIFTLLLVLIMALSLAGCADTSWVISANGTVVSSGVYTYYQTQGYVDAVYQLAETNQAYYEYYTQGYSLLNESLEDGTLVSDYADQFAMDMSRQYIVVDTLFNELGLTLSEEDLSTAEKQAKNIWRSSENYLTAIGVTLEDLKAINESTIKEARVFDAYYEIGGVKGTTDEDINAYIDDEYARVKIIEFNFSESADDAIDSELKNNMLAIANLFLERANAGEDFNKLIEEFLSDEAIESEKDNPYPYEYIMTPDGTDPSPKFIKYLFSTCKVGEFKIIQDDISFYLVQRLNMLEREDIMEEARRMIISELYDKDYTALINNTLKGYTIETNEKALKVHTPQKAITGEK